jgi:GAF domain-containing protein
MLRSAEARGRTLFGEGIIGTVAQSRRGMVVNEYQTSPYANPCVLAHAAITAVIAEPLVCRDTLLGVITLSNEGTERAFGDEDGRLLALFAAQAAIAIENANLYAAIHGHAAALEQRVATDQGGVAGAGLA